MRVQEGQVYLGGHFLNQLRILKLPKICCFFLSRVSVIMAADENLRQEFNALLFVYNYLFIYLL